MNLNELCYPGGLKGISDLFVTFGASKRHLSSLPLEFKLSPESRVGYRL